MNSTLDLANGIFELVGGLLLLANVYQLYRDKQVKGTTAYAIVFFTGWGLFNLIFYPAQNLWWSFAGGLLVAVANTMWLGLYLCYSWRNYRRRHKFQGLYAAADAAIKNGSLNLDHHEPFDIYYLPPDQWPSDLQD